MSNDVVDQIRQLADAYDELVDDISIDEIVGQLTEPAELDEGRWTEANVQFPVSRLRHRLAFAAAAVLLIVGAAGALVLAGRDGSGRGDPADVLGVPTTSAVEGEGLARIPPTGHADYATTERPLLLWPDATVSDPPATTNGYGMRVCDGGWGTKILRVDAATGLRTRTPARSVCSSISRRLDPTPSQPALLRPTSSITHAASGAPTRPLLLAPAPPLPPSPPRNNGTNSLPSRRPPHRTKRGRSASRWPQQPSRALSPSPTTP